MPDAAQITDSAKLRLLTPRRRSLWVRFVPAAAVTNGRASGLRGGEGDSLQWTPRLRHVGV